MGGNSSKPDQHKSKKSKRKTRHKDGFQKSEEEFDHLDHAEVKHDNNLIKYKEQLDVLEKRVQELQGSLKKSQTKISELETERDSIIKATERSKTDSQQRISSSPSTKPVPISSTALYEQEIQMLKNKLIEVENETLKCRVDGSNEVTKEKRLREQAENSLAEYIKACNQQQIAANETLQKKLNEALEREKTLKERLAAAEKRAAQQILRKSTAIERLELEKMLLQQEKNEVEQQLKSVQSESQSQQNQSNIIEEDKHTPTTTTTQTTTTQTTTTTTPEKTITTKSTITPTKIPPVTAAISGGGQTGIPVKIGTRSQAIPEQRNVHHLSLQGHTHTNQTIHDDDEEKAKAALRERILQSKSGIPVKTTNPYGN